MGFIERRGYAHDENCSCSYCQKERQKKERQELEGEKAQAVERVNYILRTEANKVRIRKEIEEKLSHKPPELPSSLDELREYYGTENIQGLTPDDNWVYHEYNGKKKRRHTIGLSPATFLEKIMRYVSVQWKKFRHLWCDGK